MACCKKKVKTNYKKKIKEDKFFNSSKILAESMADANLSDLQNRNLLDYHRKCHMLYGGNMKKKPLNKKFINSIVDLHDRIVKEMEKRKMKHNTPLTKL